MLRRLISIRHHSCNFLLQRYRKHGYDQKTMMITTSHKCILVLFFLPKMHLLRQPFFSLGQQQKLAPFTSLPLKRAFLYAPKHQTQPTSCRVPKLAVLAGKTELNAWETTDLADDDVRVLAKFQSLYNHVQVLEVSRRADHTLSGSRLLLLDRPGNIQSVYNPYKVITDSYYDVFATLPPLLPEGPVGILGLGAGTAARILLHFWPHLELHGWELDPSVVMIARQYFDLGELEVAMRPHPQASAFEDPIPGVSSENGRLVVHVGDAFEFKPPTEEGFAGIIVDMFSDGAVVPALQQPQTWQHLRQKLKPGGRIMVNCGGSCVEADKKSKDGEVTMEETLEAMLKAFPAGEILKFNLPGKGNNCVALSGPSPDLQAWEQALPLVLRQGVHTWTCVS